MKSITTSFNQTNFRLLKVINLIKPASILFISLSLITGIFYPLIITVISQLAFKHEANGSLIMHQGNIIGSELIGQNFNQPQYFWSRPSAASNFANNGLASGGSNLSVDNPTLIKNTQQRVNHLNQYNNLDNKHKLIPIDLVTSSASGLDPHISIQGAYYQAQRIANYRNIPIIKIYQIIEKNIQTSKFNIIGENYINVLKLNLELDNLLYLYDQN